MDILGIEFNDREASLAIVSVSVFTPAMAKAIAKGDRSLEAEINALIFKARSVVYKGL